MERDGSVGDLEAIGEPVFPKKLFAFGLGYEKLVHPDIGTFIKYDTESTLSLSLSLKAVNISGKNTFLLAHFWLK